MDTSSRHRAIGVRDSSQIHPGAGSANGEADSSDDCDSDYPDQTPFLIKAVDASRLPSKQAETASGMAPAAMPLFEDLLRDEQQLKARHSFEPRWISSDGMPRPFLSILARHLMWINVTKWATSPNANETFVILADDDKPSRFSCEFIDYETKKAVKVSSYMDFGKAFAKHIYGSVDPLEIAKEPDRPWSAPFEVVKVVSVKEAPPHDPRGVTKVVTADRTIEIGEVIGFYEGQYVLDVEHDALESTNLLNEFEREYKVLCMTTAIFPQSLFENSFMKAISKVNDYRVDPFRHNTETHATKRNKKKSSESNLGIFEVIVAGWPYFLLITRKKVNKGGELLLDYGSTYWPVIKTKFMNEKTIGECMKPVEDLLTALFATILPNMLSFFQLAKQNLIRLQDAVYNAFKAKYLLPTRSLVIQVQKSLDTIRNVFCLADSVSANIKSAIDSYQKLKDSQRSETWGCRRRGVLMPSRIAASFFLHNLDKFNYWREMASVLVKIFESAGPSTNAVDLLALGERYSEDKAPHVSPPQEVRISLENEIATAITSPSSVSSDLDEEMSDFSAVSEKDQENFQQGQVVTAEVNVDDRFCDEVVEEGEVAPRPVPVYGLPDAIPSEDHVKISKGTVKSMENSRALVKPPVVPSSSVDLADGLQGNFVSVVGDLMPENVNVPVSTGGSEPRFVVSAPTEHRKSKNIRIPLPVNRTAPASKSTGMGGLDNWHQDRPMFVGCWPYSVKIPLPSGCVKDVDKILSAISSMLSDIIDIPPEASKVIEGILIVNVNKIDGRDGPRVEKLVRRAFEHVLNGNLSEKGDAAVPDPIPRTRLNSNQNSERVQPQQSKSIFERVTLAKRENTVVLTREKINGSGLIQSFNSSIPLEPIRTQMVSKGENLLCLVLKGTFFTAGEDVESDNNPPKRRKMDETSNDTRDERLVVSSVNLKEPGKLLHRTHSPPLTESAGEQKLESKEEASESTVANGTNLGDDIRPAIGETRGSLTVAPSTNVEGRVHEKTRTIVKNAKIPTEMFFGKFGKSADQKSGIFSTQADTQKFQDADSMSNSIKKEPEDVLKSHKDTSLFSRVASLKSNTRKSSPNHSGETGFAETTQAASLAISNIEKSQTPHALLMDKKANQEPASEATSDNRSQQNTDKTREPNVELVHYEAKVDQTCQSAVRPAKVDGPVSTSIVSLIREVRSQSEKQEPMHAIPVNSVNPDHNHVASGKVSEYGFGSNAGRSHSEKIPTTENFYVRQTNFRDSAPDKVKLQISVSSGTARRFDDELALAQTAAKSIPRHPRTASKKRASSAASLESGHDDARGRDSDTSSPGLTTEPTGAPATAKKHRVSLPVPSASKTAGIESVSRAGIQMVSSALPQQELQEQLEPSAAASGKTNLLSSCDPQVNDDGDLLPRVDRATTPELRAETPLCAPAAPVTAAAATAASASTTAVSSSASVPAKSSCRVKAKRTKLLPLVRKGYTDSSREDDIVVLTPSGSSANATGNVILVSSDSGSDSDVQVTAASLDLEIVGVTRSRKGHVIIVD
ncbi:hypothetical protein HDU83_005898 [Entophlyctis luteolus]|nr:hypothetical protein HDU83_005898 [Entophlyctis luteolus]